MLSVAKHLISQMFPLAQNRHVGQPLSALSMIDSSQQRCEPDKRPSSVVLRPAITHWLDPTAVLWSLALLALSIQPVLYLIHAAKVLPYPFDLDQGEGYDVNAGWRIAQGLSIYTDNESFPYYSSNYPPVYSLAVAASIAVAGPNLLSGRLVSLAATAVLAGLVFVAARRPAAFGGVIAIGLFFLSNYVFHVTPLARVNALTACLALAGLVCLRRPTGARVVFGVGLLLLALFTKPTAVDAVGAGLAFLWLARSHLALPATLGLVAAAICIVAALEMATSGAFSLNVFLGNVNPFIPGQLEAYVQNFALLHAVPVALGFTAAVRAVRARECDPVDLYLATGLLMALGVGKWGAGESYFLSAIVAASVLGGRLASMLAEAGGPLSRLVAVLLIVQCLVSAHGEVSSLIPTLPDRGLQAAALAAEPGYSDLERGQGIVTRLRSSPGEALVEDPGFELAAGRQVIGNATHLRNLYQAGLWRPNNLVSDLYARRYHTVVLDAELYPEPVLSAIGRHYFLYDTVAVYRASQQVFLPGAS